MSGDLRDTPLAASHERAGARMAGFAGWELPVSFAGTLAEHRAVRSEVGIFDVSHLGSVWLIGPDAAAVLAAALTNDPHALAIGGSQYTLCADEHGGIVDDLILYRTDDQQFLAMPNAANTEAVIAALRDAVDGADASLDDASPGWAVIAVQGPGSLHVADQGLDQHAGTCAGLAHLTGRWLEHDGVSSWVARTGYTGELGVELVVPAGGAVAVWDRLVAAGATPCGLGARDTLRLEMGYPLHGNELSTEVTPYEARLGFAVKLDRGDFRGRDALRAAKERGPPRRVWGLVAPGRRAPRAGMELRSGGSPVGVVTSGAFSPTREVGIGLALLDDPLGPGDTVELDLRGDPVVCEVVRPPMVERDPKG